MFGRSKKDKEPTQPNIVDAGLDIDAVAWLARRGFVFDEVVTEIPKEALEVIPREIINILEPGQPAIIFRMLDSPEEQG